MTIGTDDGNWPRAIVSGFPGPALVADVHGRVLLRNRAAMGVLTVVDGEGEHLRSDVGRRAATLALKGSVERWPMTVAADDGGAERSFAVTAIPVPPRGGGEPVVAVLAAESTVEVSLRNALIQSRAFFRDLVAGTGDLVWAVNGEGIFTYASGPGFAGLGAQQLHGAHWEDMFASEADRLAAAAVFESTEPLDGVDLWMDADGGRRCYRITLKPLAGADGACDGVRGVARDVTELRRLEREAEKARLAEDRLNGVLRDMGAEADPEAMLATAASGVVAAAGLSGCWIFQRRRDSAFDIESATTLHVVPRRHARASVHHGSTILRDLAGRAGTDGSDDIVTGTQGDWDFLAAAARHGGVTLGVLCFGRQRPAGATAPNWDDDDLQLIARIADQVGVAIRIGEQHHHLLTLSRCDALTGLLNRRAFLEDAGRRLASRLEHDDTAAVLFIDLDGFKSINDRSGHETGDRLLAAIARMISASVGSGDLVGRYGGDEFAVWLDTADEAAAMRRAEELIARTSRVGADGLVGATAMSVGVAVLDPRRPETVEQMLHRADAALYAAKATGGGASRCAGPAALIAEEDNRRETAAGPYCGKAGS